MAFEEAVNVSPGNTFILTNYMMFLLEQKSFAQFDRVLPHARRVMDPQELAVLSGLEAEFKDVVGGSGAVESDAGNQGASGPKSFAALRGALKGNRTAQGAPMQEITEEEEKDEML